MKGCLLIEIAKLSTLLVLDFYFLKFNHFYSVSQWLYEMFFDSPVYRTSFLASQIKQLFQSV